VQTKEKTFAEQSGQLATTVTYRPAQLFVPHRRSLDLTKQTDQRQGKNTAGSKADAKPQGAIATMRGVGIKLLALIMSTLPTRPMVSMLVTMT
jgi:hypothetical protein